MLQRICEITVTLDCIFRLVLCSHEEVSFNSICLNVLESVLLVNVVQEKPTLETPFKGDNVKALIKRQIVKNWSLISLRKFRKLQHLQCFLDFINQTIA